MQNNDAIRIDFEKNFAASYQSCQMELGRLSDSSYISPYTQTAWDAYLAGLAAANARIAELEADAERYRWLRDTRRPTVPAGMSAHWGRSNRVPHITQYPYQKDIDDFKFPQIDHTLPETIDAAIDAARAKEGE